MCLVMPGRERVRADHRSSIVIVSWINGRHARAEQLARSPLPITRFDGVPADLFVIAMFACSAMFGVGHPGRLLLYAFTRCTSTGAERVGDADGRRRQSRVSANTPG